MSEHLPLIPDESGKNRELHVYVATLQTAFLVVSKAA